MKNATDWEKEENQIRPTTKGRKDEKKKRKKEKHSKTVSKLFIRILFSLSIHFMVLCRKDTIK